MAQTRPTESQRAMIAADAMQLAAERLRQISSEGWTPEHDDEHLDGEIAQAAACYAYGSRLWDTNGASIWPNGWEFKPKDRRRDLIRAGALILAELERLDRANG